MCKGVHVQGELPNRVAAFARLHGLKSKKKKLVPGENAELVSDAHTFS